MYLGELEKSMMSRLGGQAALAILGVHPWGRADQLDQAPWEEGPDPRKQINLLLLICVSDATSHPVLTARLCRAHTRDGASPWRWWISRKESSRGMH